MNSQSEVSCVDILGVKISTLNLTQTVELFKFWITNKKKKRICVTPVNCVLWAHSDPSLRDLYNASDLNLADGVPLVWASRLLGNKIRGRVTGLDLLPLLCEEGNKYKYRFFLLGAKEGVAEKLAHKLFKQFPGLTIAGYYSPPMASSFSEAENNKMIDLVNSSKSNILWLSLTAPKQDYWIAENFSRLKVNIAIGVGGAFEVSAGLIKRAPTWMQRSGLEWFYRFVQEPRRLFHRYFIEAPKFIPLVIAQWLKRK